MTGAGGISKKTPHQTGLALIEVLTGLSLMAVGLLALASATTAGTAAMAENRETARATEAARQVLEELDAGEIEFGQLFAAYAPVAAAVPTTTPPPTSSSSLLKPLSLLKPVVNLLNEVTDPILDPATPVRCATFAVSGLDATRRDLNGVVGRIVFPTVDGPDGAELREDVAGRDLNGDGEIDSENHAHDYVLLPVTVRLEWKGTTGVRSLELHSLLVRD